MDGTTQARPRWQDWVFTVGSSFFTLALVPSLLDGETVIPLWTSVPTAAILFVFSVTKWNLGLRFAAVSESVTGTAWVLMAVLRH